MKPKSLVKGAIILTVANIITRVIGFVYRIYMSNLIGAEGMGLFQLIMPVYMLAWSISSSGFSTTVSKLTAQENAKREYGNMGRILKQTLIICASIGFLLSIILFSFTDFIALNFLKDTRTVLALKIIAVCFPFMAVASCIRGYFFGLQQQEVPAVSQVLEQLIRMLAIFLVAGTFMPKGLSYACAAAGVGITAGEVLSCAYIIFSYYKFKRKNKLIQKPSISSYAALASIISMAIPLTLNRVTGSLLSSVENILIPQKLVQFGMTSQEALSSYGQLTGMAMPLVYFPSAFLMALAITLVPEITSQYTLGNTKRLQFTVSKSILFSVTIGIAASAIFITFPTELGDVIYNQPDIGKLLIPLAFMCPFIYFQSLLSGILNGLGEHVFIFRNSLFSSAINIFFVIFFVPRFGTNAFLLGWFISLLLVTLLCIVKVNKVIQLKTDIINWIIKPTICALAASLTTKYIGNNIIFGLTRNQGIGLIITTLILVSIYFASLILTGCISKDDIKMIRKQR